MARKPLNPRQLEVLQWIADGCPDGVMSDFTYKTTAAALQSRRLAKVTRRGGWRAEATPEGRSYLTIGTYSEDRAQDVQKPARPQSRVRPTTPTEGPTTSVERRDRRAAASPFDTPTSLQDSDNAEPRASRQEGAPVTVPSQLRVPHPAVVALRDNKARFTITSLARNRALRILQGLIDAAELAGYMAQEVRPERGPYGCDYWDSKHHLVIDTGETKVGLRVLQETDRSPHEPTAQELDYQTRWGTHPPKYDHTPNEKLRIEIDTRWDGRRHTWSDGQRASLERKLPDLLDEIAARHSDARERRLAADREAADRERRRLLAVERAKVLLRESYRADVLTEQAARWREADALREYVNAILEVASGMDDSLDQTAAVEWATWASRYADELDPLRSELKMPDDPEPTTLALGPFMHM